jgi:hypothetical protein
MPFAKALARAGSFEALLPHLRGGRILARHKGLFTWPEARWKSGPGNIRPEWWANARVDPATGRVILTTPGSRIISAGRPLPPPTIREVFAVGIELEAAAVERLFPAPPKPPRRTSGPKQSAVWDPLLIHLDAMIACGKIANPAEDTFAEARRWLETSKRSLSDDALRRGIKRNRPKWFEA